MPKLQQTLINVRDAIVERSGNSRTTYLKHLRAQKNRGKASSIACSNLAHAVAASPASDKQLQISDSRLNLGIINAYNDMLSAHKPYEHYPAMIRQICQRYGATAQVASGVPAMCDGVTQGREGMELSLFSRDVIAMSTAIGLSHEVFDGAILLGVCDKIVPGLLIGALQMGHLPSIFIPAGPMHSGLSNDKKKEIRKLYITNRVGREELLASEMQAYHGIGTCTFYGTANSNQMLLEAMGLHRPNHAFFNPDSELRPLLLQDNVEQLIRNVQQVGVGIGEMLSAESFVNALVALLATGGSTNHTIHWLAVAAAAGFQLNWQDIAQLSKVVPQITKVYPNGSYDVNDFQAAGGPATTLRYLLQAGLLFEEVQTVNGDGLWQQCQTPDPSSKEKIRYQPANASANLEIIRPADNPFKATGGICVVQGNLGKAIVKTSALVDSELSIKAAALVFEDQHQLAQAFKDGQINHSAVVVVRQQGPRSNGMPELHQLMTVLAAVRDAGHQVALLTDGRLSGASGQVLAAIHLVPETGESSPISKIANGDVIEICAHQGILQLHVAASDLEARPSVMLRNEQYGFSRTLFARMRQIVGSADTGASLW